MEHHRHSTGQLVSDRHGVFNRPWRLGQCVAQYGNWADVRYPLALFAPALHRQALISWSGFREKKPAVGHRHRHSPHAISTAPIQFYPIQLDGAISLIVSSLRKKPSQPV